MAPVASTDAEQAAELKHGTAAFVAGNDTAAAHDLGPLALQGNPLAAYYLVLISELDNVKPSAEAISAIYQKAAALTLSGKSPPARA